MSLPTEYPGSVDDPLPPDVDCLPRTPAAPANDPPAAAIITRALDGAADPAMRASLRRLLANADASSWFARLLNVAQEENGSLPPNADDWRSLLHFARELLLARGTSAGDLAEDLMRFFARTRRLMHGLEMQPLADGEPHS